MPDTEEMMKLADRLEQASGPDEARELFQEAWIAAFGGCDGLPDRLYRIGGELSAAMLLVPERWPSMVVGVSDDGRAYAQLANDGHMMAEDPSEFYVEAEAATASLALCSASLRARANGGGE